MALLFLRRGSFPAGLRAGAFVLSVPGTVKKGKRKWAGDKRSRIFTAILILTAISLMAFLLEAAVLGYVPFFVRGVPHAYSYFHISGVHYFTVSCVLVPSMAVLWLFRIFARDGKMRGSRKF